MKSNFCKFQKSKNVTFGNFRDSELWILVIFGLKSCSNLLKSKFSTFKIAKRKFLDCLNSSKFDFMQNQIGGKIIKFQQSWAFNSHFESFWTIVIWYFQLWSYSQFKIVPKVFLRLCRFGITVQLQLAR